jgi:hypothetical protein
MDLLFGGVPITIDHTHTPSHRLKGNEITKKGAIYNKTQSE